MNKLAEITVLIVDDEAHARKLLKRLLSDLNNIRVIGQAGSVDEAFEIIESDLPDVILLDIEMPNQNGFDLVAKMKSSNLVTEIIFTTAYSHYAIKAIQHAAFDYLLKPIDVVELKKAFNRLRCHKNDNQSVRVNRLLEAVSNPKRIKINVRSGFIMVDFEELIFAEADGNYSTLHLSGGVQEVASQNLGKLEKSLPSSTFIRISRSHLINLNYLVYMDRRHKKCTLNVNGSKLILPVSSRHIKPLEAECEKLSSRSG